MKKLRLPLVLVAAALVSFLQAPKEISKKERRDAIAHFKATRLFLQKEIRGLSEAQLNWKPADSVWSIANCVEHIAVTEKGIYDWAMATLQEPVDSKLDLTKKPADEDILTKVADRSTKAKAPEVFRPSGRFGTTAAAYDAFDKKRDSLIQYMKTTKDDLRGHYSTTFFGPTDVYQILLLLSTHTKRHTLQIVELKAMPGFPSR